MYTFEKHTQNVFDHHKKWEILGTGGYDKVGVKKNYFYNIYYCPLCKKVYYEDCHFRKDLIKVFYSKKATVDYLIELTYDKARNMI